MVAALLWFFGSALLGFQSHWKIYQSFSGHMAFLAVVNVSALVSMCLSTYEMAQGRFRYLWYVVPISAAKAIGLYMLTGYAFFEGILPKSWMQALAALNPCRLGFLLMAFLVTNLVVIGCQCVDTFGKRKGLRHE